MQHLGEWFSGYQLQCRRNITIKCPYLQPFYLLCCPFPTGSASSSVSMAGPGAIISMATRKQPAMFIRSPADPEAESCPEGPIGFHLRTQPKPPSAEHHKKRGMIRRERSWIASQDGGNSRMPFEFPIQKPSHSGSVPAGGVDKHPVKR